MTNQELSVTISWLNSDPLGAYSITSITGTVSIVNCMDKT